MKISFLLLSHYLIWASSAIPVSVKEETELQVARGADLAAETVNPGVEHASIADEGDRKRLMKRALQDSDSEEERPQGRRRRQVTDYERMLESGDTVQRDRRRRQQQNPVRATSPPPPPPPPKDAKWLNQAQFGSNFGSSGFGSSGFGSSGFGSSGFGSSGFGSSGLGTSGFGTSSFGSRSFTNPPYQGVEDTGPRSGRAYPDQNVRVPTSHVEGRRGGESELAPIPDFFAGPPQEKELYNTQGTTFEMLEPPPKPRRRRQNRSMRERESDSEEDNGTEKRRKNRKNRGRRT